MRLRRTHLFPFYQKENLTFSSQKHPKLQKTHAGNGSFSLGSRQEDLELLLSL